MYLLLWKTEHIIPSVPVDAYIYAPRNWGIIGSGPLPESRLNYLPRLFENIIGELSAMPQDGDVITCKRIPRY